MRNLVSSLTILFLSSCATVPIVSRYLLPEIEPDGKQSIEVSKLDLPDYLDHGDVVLELKDGSFHQANFHKWGEPLEDGMIRLLEGRMDKESMVAVELVVDRFHGLETGGVTFSGRWRERGGVPSDESNWNYFELEGKVLKSGFASMVQAQGQLVGQLRELILSELGR